MSSELSDTKRFLVDRVAAGDTRRKIAELMDVSVDTVHAMIARDDALRVEVERAEEKAASIVLDEIRAIPTRDDISAHRARVNIEAYRTYLELRFPSRYGKSINLNVKTLDMNKALEQARERASRVLEGKAQVIDSQRQIEHTSTDTLSVDAATATELADLLE